MFQNLPEEIHGIIGIYIKYNVYKYFYSLKRNSQNSTKLSLFSKPHNYKIA